MIIRTLALAVTFLTLCCSAAPAWSAPPYLGSFIYRYDDGSVYRVTVSDAAHLRWEALEGPEQGKSADEVTERKQVRPDVYFVSWVEKSGVNVVQVVDLTNMKLVTNVYDGKNRYVSEAAIRRE